MVLKTEHFPLELYSNKIMIGYSINKVNEKI